MHTSPTPSLYFRLSLLGHQVMDALRGVRGADLTQAPVLRYLLVGTLGLAVVQATSQERAGQADATPPTVVTAGLFGGGTATDYTDLTAGDLAAIEAYTPAIARYARELGLERSALAGATLLRARTADYVDVAALASELKAAAKAEGATTATAWVAAAGMLFGDAATAQAEVAHLIRRYGL